jgi:hypothetical protein
MNALLLIYLPDGHWIGLSPEGLAQAIAAAEGVMPTIKTDSTPQTLSDELLTAEQIAAKTNMDASWFLEQARLNQIPFVQLGKYKRFSLSAVTAHLARGAETRSDCATRGRKPLKDKAL